MFITFEGLDFSGKTTQAKRLIERLRAAGQTVQFIREPGGTRISERIRTLLLDKDFPEMSETAELFLFSASRTQLVREVILPALRRGETVVCDRYHDSTTAYQGYGRGLDREAVHLINRFATLGVNPDITILIDIPIDEIERRKKAAGLAFDRMESSGREFYERVRNGYHELAGKEKRFVLVNGVQHVDDVERELWNAVQQQCLSHKPVQGREV